MSFEQGRRGEKPLHTSTSFYAFQHGGPNRCCPPSAAARSVVQLSKHRQAVQPKSLKRTAGAVSSDGGLWSFSLRGAAVACMGRSLSDQTLAACGDIMAEKYNIFFSYSHRDSGIARHLVSKLEEAGLRCFPARSITPSIVTFKAGTQPMPRA